VFVPLERMFHVRNLSPLRPGWRTDLSYYFFSQMLVQFILIVVTTSTATMDSLIASASVKAWIQNLPLWLQFLAAVFFADLFQAGLHRVYHHVPFLWRFHAVHHSSRHMDWLTGSRVHLIEVLMTRSAVLLPLVVLGFAQEAINAYIILVGIQAVLVHANIDFDFGWLEYYTATITGIMRDMWTTCTSITPSTCRWWIC
jgi:sterol desaturase/sphingolipid hydroxylase (fatty acid hydroxylase superfamily)